MANEFNVKNGLVVRNTATIANLDKFVVTTSSYVTSSPTLNLNFSSARTLDPRINFQRASNGTYVGVDGFIKYAGTNQPRIEYSFTATGQSLGLLIEEQRANIIRYSNNIGNSYNRCSIISRN